MNKQLFRVKDLGQVDRSKPLRFKFDGKFFVGYRGDTLASALLANGIHLVGRSFKYHRPRGILSAGAEEPNALVQVGEGNGTDPNTRATQIKLEDGLIVKSQNRWPSLLLDLGYINNLLHRLLPAGFYYKTFMWPSSWWMRYEYWIRRIAGLGEAPKGADPDRYEKTHAHCDVLIVGGGPAGLSAALAAGKTGARVVLVDEQDSFGGSLNSNTDCTVDEHTTLDWRKRTLAILEGMPEVILLNRTVATGYYDHNFLTLLETVSPGQQNQSEYKTRQRLWKIRAKRVVLATGALERPLVFKDNDRPGIMLSASMRAYLNQYGVSPGNRVLLFTNNDDAYRTAISLKENNIPIAGIVDLREDPTGELVDRIRHEGIALYPGYAIVSTTGHLRIKSVRIMKLNDDGTKVIGNAKDITCDCIGMSGGWNPTVHLFSQSGGKLEWDDKFERFLPKIANQPLISIGACNGTQSLSDCLKDGLKAGAESARATNNKGRAPGTPRVVESKCNDERAIWIIPRENSYKKNGKYFVDFQNDVTASDISLAAREGYRSVEHLKRYTTMGMGTDQGKTSNVTALAILGETLGTTAPNIGHTTFRPPYTPATIGAYAGRNVGALFDPIRTTAMHEHHEEFGAKFEHVSQWMRAWYYPKPNETMQQTINREVKAARDSIGLLDASTLGKIDIKGLDAAEFLNRIYTNSWLKLAPGKARYGLMLKEDGMVMDDGVTTHLNSNHYHMTTTTGGAASVLDWLEEWHQTEWPDLDVYFTSVTEHWAVASICGPNCRSLLAELAPELDLSDEAFPFMTVKEGDVAGIAARIFRISFTGELSFEINVPRRYGLALWQALIEKGEKYDICPYGTEAMHVLRAEKGFIIVGQETDGTVTPHDLGMDWIVSKTKHDFIGKRALSRSDMLKSDRKQLVGLLNENENEVIPEGSQIVEMLQPSPPMAMIGHITSSYYSPNCNRSIAMALIKGGKARIGKTLHIPLKNKTIKVKVTDTLFLDKNKELTDG
ncbi:MAG: sarcosine oxidase subunit alpha [Rhodospirillaceae bacterium]|nr:sarcosine oxidase subunit alpha [Rhodospirillaceae bacterium]